MSGFPLKEDEGEEEEEEAEEEEPFIEAEKEDEVGSVL